MRALHSAVQISNTASDTLIDYPLSAVETRVEIETIIDAGTENGVIDDNSAETDSNISLITLNGWIIVKISLCSKKQLLQKACCTRIPLFRYSLVN